MRATEFLTESPLTPANLFDPRHLAWRPNHFLKKIIECIFFQMVDWTVLLA
jgi:hypothetical protein